MQRPRGATAVQTRMRKGGMPLTLFLSRDIVCLGRLRTSTRQRAACLVEASASLRKRLDAAHGSARGDWGRGLMLRDMSLAAAGLECSAVLSLHRGADQPAQLNDLGT